MTPPGPSVHWISQTRIGEWVAISFSRKEPGSPALQADSLLRHQGRRFCFFNVYLAVLSLSGSQGSRIMQDSSLQCRDSQIAVCRLSCFAACGILVPWPGIEPISPEWQGTTGPPGKAKAWWFLSQHSSASRHTLPLLYRIQSGCPGELSWEACYWARVCPSPSMTKAILLHRDSPPNAVFP